MGSFWTQASSKRLSPTSHSALGALKLWRPSFRWVSNHNGSNMTAGWRSILPALQILVFKTCNIQAMSRVLKFGSVAVEEIPSLSAGEELVGVGLLEFLAKTPDIKAWSTHFTKALEAKAVIPCFLVVFQPWILIVVQRSPPPPTKLTVSLLLSHLVLCRGGRQLIIAAAFVAEEGEAIYLSAQVTSAVGMWALVGSECPIDPDTMERGGVCCPLPR